MFFFDSPAGMSIHEEATDRRPGTDDGRVQQPDLYDQKVPQAGMKSIVPDLASAWTWNADGTALTFTLRQGVSWHDGKPFTARDVK